MSYFQEIENGNNHTNSYSNQIAEQLLKIKENLFSGKLVIQATAQQNWEIFFYLGRIIYATGGVHPVRRWVRNFTLHCLGDNFAEKYLENQDLLTNIHHLSPLQIERSWEYYLLVNWVQEGKINREKAIQHIQSSVMEVLFEINQAINSSMRLICSLENQETFSPQLTLIDTKQAWLVAKNNWQTWTNCNLGDISPNKSITLIDARQLEESIASQSYQILINFLNGQYTLREIAACTQYNLTQIVGSFLPYIKSGIFQLTNVVDFTNPLSLIKKQPQNNLMINSAPLIACIDDSELICKQMESICMNAGYRYMSVIDPIRAIPFVLSKKPQLVFLDLVMPNTNGYEICSTFRKVSSFQDIPIIIMTANHGLIDRLRGKVAGATDLITKPINQENILPIINKHLSLISLMS